MGIRPVNRGPFGGEPIIFDTLLFVREACQIRRLEVSRPCLAERGLRVETHCFVFGWGLCDSRAPGGYVTRFLGGSKVRVMTWHLKNPVPPKAWGFGGKAPARSPSFNIDMYVDIHLNIDCQLSFDLSCRTYSSLASHNFACSSVSDKWVFASRTLSSMAWYAAMAAGLQKRIVCMYV